MRRLRLVVLAIVCALLLSACDVESRSPSSATESALLLGTGDSAGARDSVASLADAAQRLPGECLLPESLGEPVEAWLTDEADGVEFVARYADDTVFSLHAGPTVDLGDQVVSGEDSSYELCLAWGPRTLLVCEGGMVPGAGQGAYRPNRIEFVESGVRYRLESPSRDVSTLVRDSDGLVPAELFADDEFALRPWCDPHSVVIFQDEAVEFVERSVGGDLVFDQVALRWVLAGGETRPEWWISYRALTGADATGAALYASSFVRVDAADPLIHFATGPISRLDYIE